MATSSLARIDRTSSIETEPRTLNIQQIQFAREAALYVVNTTTIDEAFQIFTQGLEPVTRVASCDELEKAAGEEYDSDQDCDCCCCCSFKNAKQQFRDVLTAPF